LRALPGSCRPVGFCPAGLAAPDVARAFAACCRLGQPLRRQRAKLYHAADQRRGDGASVRGQPSKPPGHFHHPRRPHHLSHLDHPHHLSHLDHPHHLGHLSHLIYSRRLGRRRISFGCGRFSALGRAQGTERGECARQGRAGRAGPPGDGAVPAHSVSFGRGFQAPGTAIPLYMCSRLMQTRHKVI